MKIREKIIIAFGFFFFITAIAGLLVYHELTILNDSFITLTTQSGTKTILEKEKPAADGAIARVKDLLLFGMIAIFVSGVAMSMLLAERLIMPITRLKNSARKIAMGDFSAEIDVRGNDEIASLGRSIDSMQIILKNVIQSLDDSMKELQEKQSQLLRAEKLAAIGIFAAGMAHEINNPLTSVLTFSNLILEKMPDDDPRSEMLRIMSRETMRARNIVKQLLSFAKDAPLDPCRFDINAKIRENVEALSLPGLLEGIDIKLDLCEGLPDVYADPLQMDELFSNMLLNAVQAIVPPGTILISTAREHAGLKIIIADTGQGIPIEYLDQIFDPFFTTKGTMGTGLGLALSYDIIKKHNGDIEVASKLNEGTSFIIRLPTNEQDQGISS